MPGCRRVCLLTIASLAVSLTGQAQEALSLTENQPSGPLVSKEEVSALGRIVGLSADQAEAVEALREGLEGDFKSAVRRRQEVWDNLQSEAQARPEVDQSAAIQAEARRFRGRCADLERGFLTDVLSILTAEQTAHWQDFERYRRRTRDRGWWQRPASDADLVKVVGGLGLGEAQAAAVRPLLDEYERELDPAVIARLEVKREAAEVDFGADYEKRTEWYARVYDRTQALDQRLAGVNRKYARLIVAALPAEKQGEFETRFAEASYINLYTPSEDRKRLDASERLADLTAEQKADLERILTPFRRQVAVVERQAEALEDEYAYQYSWDQLSAGRMPAGYNERYNDIWAMEAKALAAVRKVLNEEQRDRVAAAGR